MSARGEWFLGEGAGDGDVDDGCRKVGQSVVGRCGNLPLRGGSGRGGLVESRHEEKQIGKCVGGGRGETGRPFVPSTATGKQ